MIPNPKGIGALRSDEDILVELNALLAALVEEAGIRLTGNPGIFTRRGRIEAALLMSRALVHGHREVSLLDCQTEPPMKRVEDMTSAELVVEWATWCAAVAKGEPVSKVRRDCVSQELRKRGLL